jgi:hypothetical protein
MLVFAALSGANRLDSVACSQKSVEMLLISMKSTLAWTQLCDADNRRKASAWLFRLLAAYKTFFPHLDENEDDDDDNNDKIQDDEKDEDDEEKGDGEEENEKKKGDEENDEKKEDGKQDQQMLDAASAPPTTPAPPPTLPADHMVFMCLRVAASEVDSRFFSASRIASRLSESRLYKLRFKQACPTKAEREAVAAWLKFLFEEEERQFLIWASRRFSGPLVSSVPRGAKAAPSPMLQYALIDAVTSLTNFNISYLTQLLESLQNRSTWRMWCSAEDRAQTRDWLLDLLAEYRLRESSSSRSGSGACLPGLSSPPTNALPAASSTFAPSPMLMLACLQAATEMCEFDDQDDVDRLVRLLEFENSCFKDYATDLDKSGVRAWLQSLLHHVHSHSKLRGKVLPPLPSYCSPYAPEEQDLSSDVSIKNNGEKEEDNAEYAAWKPSKALLLATLHASTVTNLFSYDDLYKHAQCCWLWEACSAQDRRFAGRWYRQLESESQSELQQQSEKAIPTTNDSTTTSATSTTAVLHRRIRACLQYGPYYKPQKHGPLSAAFYLKKESPAAVPPLNKDESFNLRNLVVDGPEKNETPPFELADDKTFAVWVEDLFAEQQRLLCSAANSSSNMDAVQNLLASNPLLCFAILAQVCFIKSLYVYSGPGLAEHIPKMVAFAKCPVEVRQQLISCLRVLLREANRLSEQHSEKGAVIATAPVTNPSDSNQACWKPSLALFVCAMKAAMQHRSISRDRDVDKLLAAMQGGGGAENDDKEEQSKLWQQHLSEQDRANAKSWLQSLIKAARDAEALGPEPSDKEDENEDAHVNLHSLLRPTPGANKVVKICPRCLAQESFPPTASSSSDKMEDQAEQQKEKEMRDAELADSVPLDNRSDLSGPWTLASEEAVGRLASHAVSLDPTKLYKIKLAPGEIGHLVQFVQALVTSGCRVEAYDAPSSQLWFRALRQSVSK